MATTDIPGRYGRSRAGRGPGGGSRRGVKILAAVLGAALLGFVAWAGATYLSRTPVSGQMLSYRVVDAGSVRAQVEVTKDSGMSAVCTVRSRSENGAEVGRRTVRITDPASSVRTWVDLRTTARATNAELVGCEKG